MINVVIAFLKRQKRCVLRAYQLPVVIAGDLLVCFRPSDQSSAFSATRGQCDEPARLLFQQPEIRVLSFRAACGAHPAQERERIQADEPL